MKIVITGGNGFIGSHLVGALMATGHRLTVIDRGEPRPDIEWEGVSYIKGCFDDPAILKRALDGADLVYHLASTTVPGNANLDPAGDVQGNLLGTLNLLGAMDRVGCTRLVYLSSGGTVYGDVDVDEVAEDSPTRPISSYGIVKQAIERYLLMSQRIGKLRPIILRASNPYGARQGKVGVQGLVSTAVERIYSGHPINIWGDGSAVRDYIYVSDLIELMVKAGNSCDTGVFNAGSGKGSSVNEIIEKVSSAMGMPAIVNYGPSRPFDVARVVLDIKRASTAFGWSPRVTLNEGLRATVLAWQRIS